MELKITAELPREWPARVEPRSAMLEARLLVLEQMLAVMWRHVPDTTFALALDNVKAFLPNLEDLDPEQAHYVKQLTATLAGGLAARQRGDAPSH